MIGVSGVGRTERMVTMRDDRADWPKGMVFSTNRAPRWTSSLDGLVFGLEPAPPEKKPAPVVGDAVDAIA